MTDYATINDVNSRRSGDAPTVSEAWNETLTGKISEISRDLDRMVGRVRGSTGAFTIVTDAEASARTFRVPDGGSQLLSIDDCTAISAVTKTLSPGATPTALVEGTDYDVVRSQGVIVALRGISGWPIGTYGTVTARWGLMDAVSSDLREATVIEVIRSYLADRASNNDQIGMTPFGQVITSKAFTSKVNKFVNDWAYGGAALRTSNQ